MLITVINVTQRLLCQGRKSERSSCLERLSFEGFYHQQAWQRKEQGMRARGWIALRDETGAPKVSSGSQQPLKARLVGNH
jgi:hypothetical protein